jgi:hypothetical protein
MQPLGERASCQLWYGLFNIFSLMQFWHINSKGAVNWINSDFVKVFESAVTFYWAKWLSYSKQMGSILKFNTCYSFWLASRRNECNQYLDSLNTMYLCPLWKSFLIFGLLSIAAWSVCDLDITATLAQLSSGSLHLLLLSAHPWPLIGLWLST